MKTFAAICLVTLVGLLQADPIILSSSDIADTYDTMPGHLADTKTWLGLYVRRTESRLEAVRVEVVAQRGFSRTAYKIVTSPPNARLLLSGVPGVSAGSAVTVGGDVDLWEQARQVEFKLGAQVYAIRLEGKQADLCDGVVTLTSGSRTQTLFDVNRLGGNRQPGPQLACDEPHFRIHWAGDLDRDGRLDMLVTFSEKYSYFPRQLLLSSVARTPELVLEVARYDRFSQ